MDQVDGYSCICAPEFTVSKVIFRFDATPYAKGVQRVQLLNLYGTYEPHASIKLKIEPPLATLCWELHTGLLEQTLHALKCNSPHFSRKPAFSHRHGYSHGDDMIEKLHAKPACLHAPGLVLLTAAGCVLA